MPAMAPPGKPPESLNIELLVDSIPALIHTARPDGYIDYFNKRWLEYFGVTLDEVAGWNWTAVIHGEDVEGILTRWRACLVTGEIFEYETRVRGANGEYRWMFHQKVPLRDANGNIVKWYGSSMDIHERKTAEEALRSSEAYLAEAQRLSQTGSFGWKPDTGEIVWSDETYRIFEYDRPVKPTIDSVMQRVHPEDRADFQKVIESASAGATQFEHTYRLLLPDGSVKHVHALAHRLQDASGNREFVGAATDVTSIKRAEEELRKSEKELRDVIDTIPAIVWSALPDGSNTYSNKHFVEYSGLSAEQTAGSGWQAAVHPDDLERHTGKWVEAFASGKPHENEVRFRRSDGQYRWQLDRGVALRDEHGTIVKWYGVTTDIEDRKRAEEALRSSEAYLAEAQRLSRTGSWAWSPDTDVRYWSEECYRVLGFDPQDGVPRMEELIRRIHPDDQPAFRESTKRAKHSKLDEEVNYRIVHPGGAVRDIHSIGHPVFSPCGDLIEYTGTVIDITERKRAEDELRQSEFYLAEAQRLTHTGSWVWQVAGRDALYLSDEWYRIYGFDPKQGMPKWEERLRRVHPEDRDRWQGTIERAIRERSNYELEFRILLPCGTLKWIHTVAHRVLNASGDLDRFVGSSMDVTERKRAEEAMGRLSRDLQESKAKLEEAQRITHVGYWEWDILTGRVNWSDETYRIYGMQPQERPMDIAACQEKIYPEDWQRGMEEALGGRARFNAECRVIRPTGEVRIAHFQGDVKRDASGQPYHMFGTVQDITDRKRTEDKIREQESELRQILDLTPQLVAVFGSNHERLYANRIVLDYVGVSLEEWRKRSAPGEFFHPDDRERMHAHFDRAHSTGSAFEVEMRTRKGDGSYRWFLARYHPLRDDKGQITRWYSAATDIDERKRAEEKLQLENAVLREEIDQTSMFEEIVGTSSALKNVLSRISKVAPSDSTVLITGETGTGKELVARAIHRRSRRSVRAFVSVNCAAIPRDLIASELFGHEKGAFTGAMQRRLGRFEMADGGTIFLDEVGELSPDTQVALLRVLQEREFERVGGGQPIRVDVRVIAATNRDLKAAVANSTFRQDLFYRLNVFPIEVPPLRERKDDILMLVEYFVQRFATKGGKRIRSIDKKTLDLLQSYAWPGNIRELQNVIERSVILSSGDVVFVDELWLSKETAVPASRVEPQSTVRGEIEPRSEREIIEAALAETRGRVSGRSGAAVILGIPPSTLHDRIKALKINKKQFKFR
jgi:PAS domain S-box-containing protein